MELLMQIHCGFSSYCALLFAFSRTPSQEEWLMQKSRLFENAYELWVKRIQLSLIVWPTSPLFPKGKVMRAKLVNKQSMLHLSKTFVLMASVCNFILAFSPTEWIHLHLLSQGHQLCRSAYAWHMPRRVRQVAEPNQTAVLTGVEHYLALAKLAPSLLLCCLASQHSVIYTPTPPRPLSASLSTAGWAAASQHLYPALRAVVNHDILTGSSTACVCGGEKYN